MNACLSGTPIVGVGMHPEQQANLDARVRKGFAVRLRNDSRITSPLPPLPSGERLGEGIANAEVVLEPFLSKRTVTASAVLDAVDKLLYDEAAKSRVMEFRGVLQQWDGPANAAKFLCKTFGVGQNTEAVRSARAEAPMQSASLE